MKKIAPVVFLSVATWFLLCCELSFGSSGDGNSGSSSAPSGSGNSAINSAPSGNGNSGNNSAPSGSGHSENTSAPSGGGHSENTSAPSGSGNSGINSAPSGGGHSENSSASSGNGNSGSSSGSSEGGRPESTSVETGTSTSNLTGSGTITAYTPGSDYIVFRTGSSTTPAKYYYTKSTVLVDPDGHPVGWTDLRPDMPVTYTYVKEADRTVVTKITLAARLPVEKKEIETTTTKP